MEGLILTAPSVKAAQTHSFINLSKLSLANLNKEPSNFNNNSDEVEEGFISVLTSGLSQLIHLERLELKNSNLVDCFQEILNCIECPLEYLGISGSSVSPSDISAFKMWKFSNTLKDLDISNVVPAERTQTGENSKFLDLNFSDISIKDASNNLRYSNGSRESEEQNFITDNLGISLVNAVQCLPSLVLLDVHGNHMTRDTFNELGDAISQHLKKIKMLRLDGIRTKKSECDIQNILDEDILKLVIQLKDHLEFQILYVTRVCRCVDNQTCSTGCKILFWDKLDDIVGSVPVKICVEMK